MLPGQKFWQIYWNCYFCVSLCSKLFHVRPVTQGDVYRAETEEIPRIFQVRGSFLSWSHLSVMSLPLSLRKAYLKSGFMTRRLFFPLVCRFCMPTRGSAGRMRKWRRSLRATRPTASHTKVTSSSLRYITSLQTVRPAPSLCGTSSSHLRPWSVAAATSSATRTISTKRRTLLLLAKVNSHSFTLNSFYILYI